MIADFPSRDHHKDVLLAIAAPAELRAVLRGLGVSEGSAARVWTALPVRPGIQVVETGISKSNAAGGVAHVLDPARHACVLSLGIAGALPSSPISAGHETAYLADIGEVIVSTASVFADEGLECPDGFLDCAALGFPLYGSIGRLVPVDAALSARLSPLGRAGRIATVSTCSGTNELANQVRERTGAVCEAMEGAAVGLVAHRLGVPFAEVRVISNTTGDRSAQRWDLPAALGSIERVIARLFPVSR